MKIVFSDTNLIKIGKTFFCLIRDNGYHWHGLCPTLELLTSLGTRLSHAVECCESGTGTIL